MYATTAFKTCSAHDNTTHLLDIAQMDLGKLPIAGTYVDASCSHSSMDARDEIQGLVHLDAFMHHLIYEIQCISEL
jgi:hypothetical protein